MSPESGTAQPAGKKQKGDVANAVPDLASAHGRSSSDGGLSSSPSELTAILNMLAPMQLMTRRKMAGKYSLMALVVIVKDEILNLRTEIKSVTSDYHNIVQPMTQMEQGDFPPPHVFVSNGLSSVFAMYQQKVAVGLAEMLKHELNQYTATIKAMARMIIMGVTMDVTAQQQLTAEVRNIINEKVKIARVTKFHDNDTTRIEIATMQNSESQVAAQNIIKFMVMEAHWREVDSREI